MDITRRALVGTAAALSALPIARARAQSRPLIRIGVLTDLSGTYRDNTGPMSVLCSRMAAEEFNAGAHGFDVEVLEADHQNKPDNASTITRQWFDQGVDVVADVPTSSVALAVAQVAKEKDKIMLNASATSTALTDSQCSPNTIVWSFDTYMMAVSQGGTVVKQGGNDWFFITADYAFGHIAGRADDEAGAGCRRQGARRAALSVPRHHGLLGLSDAGAGERREGARPGERRRRHRQQHQAGARIRREQDDEDRAAADASSPTCMRWACDVAQGLYCTNSFYWDRNDRTRAFTKRVLAKPGANVCRTWPMPAHIPRSCTT